MALWKPFRGTSAALADVPKTDGHAYFCTDDGSLFFDYKDENNELHRKQITVKDLEYEPLVTLTTAHAVNSMYRIANVTNSNFLSTPFTAGDCFKVNLKINDQIYEGWVVGADDSTGIITSKNPMGSYGDSGLGVLADGTAGYFGYVLPSAVAGEASFSDLVLVCIALNAEVSCDSGSDPVVTPKIGSIAIFSMFPSGAADSDPIQLEIFVSKSIVLADPMTLAGQAFVFNYNGDASISMVTPEKTSLVNFGDGGIEYYPSENTILTHSYTPSDFGVKPNALYIYGDIKHLPNNFLKGAVCLTSFELTKARTFGESAFENCVNLVCAVMHPETATISKNAFKGCTSLKDIDLRGVTTIAESAFENCSALTSITLPDSLRQIEANAFKGTGLTTVIIPAGVTSIADTAFDSTTKLIATSELANMQVASSSSKFDSLVSSENVGKAVSYNKNLYIIDKGAKEIEVGDNLNTVYFDTSIEPNLAALSYDEDGLSLALWGIDSSANREYPIIGAVRWADFAKNGATGYGLIGYASNSSDVTVIYSTTAFTISLLNFTVHKGWSVTQLNLTGIVPVTKYEAGARSVLGHVLSSAAISSDTPVAIGMLTHEEDPTVPAWAKAAEKPEYTYDEIKSKPSLATVATSGKYTDLSGTPTIPTKSSWNYDDTYVKYSAAQSLTDTQKSQARSNIGAGTSSLTLGTSASTAAAGNHTHEYAGSSSAGGSATSAVKLDTATAGGATQPVYFTGGKPTACTYTLAKSVPADAKFTDTTYSAGTGISKSGTTFSNSAGLYYVKGLTEKQVGSSTSGAYLASKWSVANAAGITTPVDGMSIAIRTPAAGYSGGVLLSIDNGTTYYPLVRNVNTLVTTVYPAGSTVILTFNATQTAKPYTSAGVQTEITGCWQTADYDVNTKTTTGTSNKTATKLYLAGATSQSSSGATTYSNKNVYIGTDNCLYSNGTKVATVNDIPSLATVATSGSYSDLSNKPTIPTNTSQLINDNDFIESNPAKDGNVKTSYRIAKQGYTNGANWYYKLCTLPANNSQNFASIIISGRIGGWESGNMSYINALVWNRGTPGISVIGIAGNATAASNIWSIGDLALYVESDGSASLYILCKNYFTFDLNVELYQSTAMITYDGTYITAPTGTATALASQASNRLELYNNSAAIGGSSVLTAASFDYKPETKTLTIG